MIGTSKNIFGFDPRSVPGCVVWLDAADTSTLSLSGSNITAWRDKSTFSNNVNSISPTAPTYNSTDSSVNFVATSGTFLRGTMSQTYSNNASVFVVASIATQTSPAFPRLSMLGLSTTANSILVGQQLYVNSNAPSVITYLPTNTNPSGQGTNIMTLISNVTYNTRQIITNISTYVGTAFTISTLLNGNSQTTSVTTRSGTFTANSTNVATYNKYSLANYPDAASTGGDSYSGKIFEYLVFNSALTITQRQQVEGYLADKWGLGGYSSPIFPLTIPGCRLWLDAADLSTITVTGITNVTQWRDKASALTLTGSGSTYTTVSGYPTITFNANQYGSTTNLPYEGVCTSDANFTTFIVQSTTSASPVNGLPFTIFLTGNVRRLAVFSSGGGSGGMFIDGASQGSPRLGGITQTLNTPQLLTITRKNITTMTARLNGLQVSTGVFAGATNFISSTSYFVYISEGSGPWRGNMYEILHYNQDLSDLQIQQVEGYLARKWGFTTIYPRLPISHPYYSLKPHLRIFQPTDISGCVLWLDAADSSSITLSGSNMTRWTDKSTTGRNMVPFTTYSNATVSSNFQNNLNVLNFSGAGVYQAPASSIIYPVDLYIMMALKDLTTHVDVVSMTASAADNFNSLSFGEYTARRWYNGSTGFARTPNTVSTSNETSTSFLLLNWSILNGNYVLRRNGTLMTQTGSYTWTPTAASIFQIGFRASPSLFSPASTAGVFRGYIGEIVAFNTQLGDSQRQEVEGYLANKWGLTLTYPTNTPLSIAGCTMWLDGADPAGTGTPPSAGTLATWVDKSLNGRNGIQYSSLARPTFVTNSLNSKGGVSFTAASSNCYQTQVVLPTPGTIFVVGFSSNDGFILSGIPTPNSGHPPYYATFARDVEFGVNNTSDTAHSANVGSTSNVNYILTGLYTGSNVTALMNGGTLSNTVAFSGTPKTPVTTLIGINSYAGSLGAPLGGTINEFITYSTSLTTAQRQQVEEYLANKWGLTLSTQLPFTHPFTRFPPSAITRPNFKELAYTSPDFNVFFAKYSPDGSVLWALRWTSTGGAAFQDSATDSSGNVYVTGLYINNSLLMYDTKGNLVRTLANSGGYDGLVAKYTSSGDLLWTSRHIGPVTTYPTGVAVDSSGNVYAGGTWDGASLTIYSAGEASSNTYGTTGGQTDGYIVKYNSSGIVQWSAKVVCSSYDQGGMSLKTDSSGNLYSVGINVFAAPTFYNASGTVGGSLAWNGTTEGMWLAKYNSSGTFQWALRFVTNDLNTSQGALSIDSSANLYVSAAYNSNLTLKNAGDGTAATMSNAGSYDAFIVKYSSAGSYIWNARVGGTGSSDEIGNAIDGSGNVYIMGRYTGTIILYTSGEASSITLTPINQYDNFIAKYTSAGVLLWATIIASTGNEYQKGISVDLAGNVYAHGSHEGNPVTFYNAGGGVGGTLTRTAPADAYLAKYTTNGIFVWAALITGLGSGNEIGSRSITDPEGNIYVGGTYSNAFLILNGV
jgi:hypothetical protein